MYNIFSDTKVKVILVFAVLSVAILSFNSISDYFNSYDTVSDNPDIVFSQDDSSLLSDQPKLIFEFNTSSWFGNCGYIEKIGGGTGVMGLHPRDVSTPTSLHQTVQLPDKEEIRLKIVSANIAGMFNPTRTCKSSCTDSVLKVKIRNLSSSETDTLDSRVLTPDEGWVSLNYDISEYSGQGVEIIAEGWGGGPCADFCGEWTAVDKFYVTVSK